MLVVACFVYFWGRYIGYIAPRGVVNRSATGGGFITSLWRNKELVTNIIGHQTRTTIRSNGDDCSYEHRPKLRGVSWRKRHHDACVDSSDILCQFTAWHMTSDTQTDMKRTGDSERVGEEHPRRTSQVQGIFLSASVRRHPCCG